MNRALSVLMVAAVLVPHLVFAQAAPTPRLSLTTTVGGTSIPDALGMKCGRNGGASAGAIEWSAGAVLRPWQLLVVQTDVRSAHSPVNGCNLVLFDVDTSYNGVGGFPFVSSTVRIGLETPPSLPLLRLTAGVGREWGAPGQQFAVIGGALGTRGRRRALLELDYMRANVSANETRFGVAPRPITVRPSWLAVRAGVEWTLRD